MTNLVNALIAGGVKSGPGLHIANWNLTEAEAIQAVISAAGPFPVIGLQFKMAGLYDLDVYSSEWLSNVSGKIQAPPGQWLDARQWSWAQAQLSGIGLNGKLSSFVLKGGGTWGRIL